MSSIPQTFKFSDDHLTNGDRQLVEPTPLNVAAMSSVERVFGKTELRNDEELLRCLFPELSKGHELSVTPSPRPLTVEDKPVTERKPWVKHDPVIEDKPIIKQTLDFEKVPIIKQVPEHFHHIKHNSLPSQLYPTLDQDLLSVQVPPRPQTSPPQPGASQHFGYPRYCASPPPISSATFRPTQINGFEEGIYAQSIEELPPAFHFCYPPPLDVQMRRPTSPQRTMQPPPLPIQAPCDYLPPMQPNHFRQPAPLTNIQPGTFLPYPYQQQHMSYPAYPSQWETPSYPEASTSSVVIRHKKRRTDRTPPYKRELCPSENLQDGIDAPKPIKCRLPKVGDQSEICNELCANAVELQRHLSLKGAHGIVNDKQGKRRYRCTWEYCTTTMGGSGNLLRHIKEVHAGQARTRKSRPFGEGRKKLRWVVGNGAWNGLTAPR